jgi:hypothetical protein
MAPWTFNVKFPYGTRFTFGSLTFAMGKDENLKMLTLGLAPECFTSVYGQSSYFLTISSTTGGAYSGLDPYTGLHIRTVKLVQDIPIVTSILQPSAGASSSSSSTASPNKIQLMITLRLREVPMGTLSRRAALSSWWPRLEDLCWTAPADIPPSGDQKHPMLRRPIMKWSGI